TASSPAPAESASLSFLGSESVSNYQDNVLVSKQHRYAHSNSRGELRVAFDVPPCVLNLPGQAKSGVGGVCRTRLKQNLYEYIMAFKTMLAELLRVLDWPDEKFLSTLGATMILVIIIGALAQGIVERDCLLRLFKRILGQCLNKRRKVLHLVKNNDNHNDTETHRKNRSDVFWSYDLQALSMEKFEENLRSNHNDNSFSSPGESFAWQLAAGFLSYVLPNMRRQIFSSLLDAQGLIREQVLTNFGLTDVNPSNILVVPKYFLLLDERAVSSQNQPVSCVCPQMLFPGCSKVSTASTELCLEFDSPGYKKRVTAYLLQLEKPLTKDQSTYSHAVVFCGYAAPMFVMQKLRMADQDKTAMFQQFRDELRFIQSHPRANSILRELSDTSSEEVAESEPSVLQVIDIAEDGDSLRWQMLAAVEDFLLIDGWSFVSRAAQQSSAESVRDELPLMSMAFAMAANTWIGFAQPLNMQQLSSSAEPIPFDLPYTFVIPKSGRYPDESKLRSQLAELGAQSSVHEFRAASGRRYSFRVHDWRSRRIAFEIPTCVLGIRKQAECRVGGIRTGDVRAHLAEFRDALTKFAEEGGNRFRVVEWDDVTGFEDESSSMDPSADFAASLSKMLFN
uniref:HECT domain-containing protein n=1 Tax=Macrostomum lignano TaxID=282301 RepID=A0A1I8FUI7_9PLAT